MNKLKEFLWFLIPFFCLGVISVLSFILTTENGASFLMSNFDDPFFIIIIIFSFIPAVMLSFVDVIIYRVLLQCVFKKKLANKKIYIHTFLISVFTSVLLILIHSSSFNIIDNTIFSLQVGIIVTFVFWVIDLIREKVNKNNQGQKSTS